MIQKELITAAISVEPNLLPQVAISPAVIRQAWLAAGESLNKDTMILVICDSETIEYLREQCQANGDFSSLRGICFSDWGPAGPPRFNVVDGKRVDYWGYVPQQRSAWFVAPAQIHVLMDGNRIVCALATRRVMSPSKPLTALDYSI